MRIRKYNIVTQRVTSLLMQHDRILNCSFSYPPKLFLLLYSESEETKYPFSLIGPLTLSMLHLFIADIGSNVSQLLPLSIILKIFSKRLIPGKQGKLILTCFSLDNIISSLALGTQTGNK